MIKIQIGPCVDFDDKHFEKKNIFEHFFGFIFFKLNLLFSFLLMLIIFFVWMHNFIPC